MKRTTPKFTVTLESAGNPDHGQFFGKGALSPTLELDCTSIAECQKVAVHYREFNNLGGGNWTGGMVKKDGKVIGRISYNGRFWPSEKALGASRHRL